MGWEQQKQLKKITSGEIPRQSSNFDLIEIQKSKGEQHVEKDHDEFGKASFFADRNTALG